MLTFKLILFFSGLCVLSYHDARTLSVPARLIDPWCGLCICLGLLLANWGQIVSVTGLTAALACFAWRTHGLGSADVMITAAFGMLFGIALLLWVILLAALSGLLWASCTRTHRLAWIPHLLLGSVLVLFSTIFVPTLWHLL